jgi:hypothetical protein
VCEADHNWLISLPIGRVAECTDIPDGASGQYVRPRMRRAALWAMQRRSECAARETKFGPTVKDQHISRLDTNTDDSGQPPNHGVAPGLRLLPVPGARTGTGVSSTSQISRGEYRRRGR